MDQKESEVWRKLYTSQLVRQSVLCYITARARELAFRSSCNSRDLSITSTKIGLHFAASVSRA